MKLRIQQNKTDTEVWEIIDTSRRWAVLVTTLMADTFNGTKAGNAIDNGIEQEGFAEIEIKVKDIKLNVETYSG